MESKQTFLPNVTRHTTSRNAWLFTVVLIFSSLLWAFWHQDIHHVFANWADRTDESARLVRKYHLQTGVRWMNPGTSTLRVSHFDTN